MLSVVNLTVENLTLERSILGTILFDNNYFESIADILLAVHFEEPFHQEVYSACITQISAGKIADVITISLKVCREGTLEALRAMVADIINPDSILEYAKIIYDQYLRRQLAVLGKSLETNAENLDGNTLLENTEYKLFQLASEHAPTSTVIDFSTIATNCIKNLKLYQDGGKRGVMTGFKNLDRIIGSLHQGDLIIVAARPSMGKTAFVANIATNLAKLGQKVLFFSLEMSAEQLAVRVLCSEISLSADMIRTGQLIRKDIERLTKKSQEIASWPLFIDDSPLLSTGAIRARARRLKRQQGLDLVIIDYLQLVSCVERKENRVQEISEITRFLKGLAKELYVPIIALSQLSRAVEQREDRRPQLADLRESGSIEQDADLVTFIYREEYYLQRSEKQEGDKKYQEWLEQMNTVKNKAEVIVSKNRNGKIGVAQLRFDSHLTLFQDLDTYH